MTPRLEEILELKTQLAILCTTGSNQQDLSLSSAKLEALAIQSLTDTMSYGDGLSSVCQ